MSERIVPYRKAAPLPKREKGEEMDRFATNSAMDETKKDRNSKDGEISITTVREGFREVIPEHLEDLIMLGKERLWRSIEMRCAINAFVEVLKMAVPQTGKRTKILKTDAGEEIDCLLIPKEEVESVLDRYGYLVFREKEK